MTTPPAALTIGETAGHITVLSHPGATMTFDGCGRAVGFSERGLFTARGMDGRCVEKRWVGDGRPAARRHLRELTDDECRALKERVSRELSRAERRVPHLAARGRFRWLTHGREQIPDPDRARRFLRELRNAARARWSTDPERFLRVWGSGGILPPDQYLALVLRLTEGCAWNRCAFCALYAARTFRVRDPRAFERHMDEAEDFYGPALAGRTSIFLGDADAFQAPPSVLVSACRAVSDRFPELARPQRDGVGGVYAFAETARLAAWTDRDLRAVADAGLRRATVGLETGCDDLRRAIKKPGSADDAIRALRRLREAGIHRGIIVLLGVGGRENAARHVERTAAVLDAAAPGPGDLVYVSPLYDDERGTLRALSLSRKWTPLTPEEILDQRTKLEAAWPSRGERRALYDIREFLP